MDNESVHKSGQKKCTHKMDKKSVHTKMGTSDQIVIINRKLYAYSKKITYEKRKYCTNYEGLPYSSSSTKFYRKFVSISGWKNEKTTSPSYYT